MHADKGVRVLMTPSLLAGATGVNRQPPVQYHGPAEMMPSGSAG